ncbi:GNAT family N-acetyltransferase [Aestuariivivens sediminis]|uniref:GNAT family N-acetyltransferase n=1 Tax=Aestuariivivens sediminis TaxID=2913557 RepID=UPI001F571A05|nr:GNAT family N-acetyltransferase [Aestuariivivens sediminis]
MHILSGTISYQRAASDDELRQILALQQKNLPQSLSLKEREQEGFVTVVHSFELLKQMNAACSHIIAKYQGEVIGYALCMTKDFKLKIPVLIPMFNEIESVITDTSTYVVMGQICIDKHMRGLGIFRGLYEYMSRTLKNKFNMIITEVDIKNTRSSNAHKSVGFRLLTHYESNHQGWELIGLDL